MSSSSSRPPAAWRTRRQPVHMRLRATSAATTGSSQARPVRRTRMRPTTMPTLVQKSESTCWPSATRVSELARRPVRTRKRPSTRLTRPAAITMARPAPSMPDLDTADQALRDLVDDEHGREGDEPALERGREELDLPVAVGMVAVGRASREDEAAQREHRGDHVDDGLERVGQDGGRAREPVGRVLRAQQHHRHAERDQPGPQADARVVANRRGNRGGDVHSEDDTPGVRPREPGREEAPGARRAAWSPPSPR